MLTAAICAAIPAIGMAQTGSNTPLPREVTWQFAFGPMVATLTPGERRAIELTSITHPVPAMAARDSLLGHPAFFVRGEVALDRQPPEHVHVIPGAMFVFMMADSSQPRLIWNVPIGEFAIGRDTTDSYAVTSCVFIVDDKTLAQQFFVDPPKAASHPPVRALLARSGVYTWQPAGSSGADGKFRRVGAVVASMHERCRTSPERTLHQADPYLRH